MRLFNLVPRRQGWIHIRRYIMRLRLQFFCYWGNVCIVGIADIKIARVACGSDLSHRFIFMAISLFYLYLCDTRLEFHGMQEISILWQWLSEPSSFYYFTVTKRKLLRIFVNLKLQSKINRIPKNMCNVVPKNLLKNMPQAKSYFRLIQKAR